MTIPFADLPPVVTDVRLDATGALVCMRSDGTIIRVLLNQPQTDPPVTVTGRWRDTRWGLDRVSVADAADRDAARPPAITADSDRNTPHADVHPVVESAVGRRVRMARARSPRP